MGSTIGTFVNLILIKTTLPQTEIINKWSTTAGLKYKSQVIVLPIQKVSLTFIKANLITPKNLCLGLIRPKVSFYECLGYFAYW